MITRKSGTLAPREELSPEASRQIEQKGYAVLRGAFASDEVVELRGEVLRVFNEYPPPRHRIGASTPGGKEDFRYEMLNRSASCQKLVADRRILDVIEPLIGEDCHVIANTAWRNLPRPEYLEGLGWHTDAGPHIPRPPGVPWDDRIPYPIFAIGTHVLLQDCPTHCGPTAVIPGSHKSGQSPPEDLDPELGWAGQAPVALTGKAGDVALFASDTWHCRLPAGPDDAGRLFVQVHYGRRDIAQRLRGTDDVNHASTAAIERAQTPRERTVIGLHARRFYDG
jgi:hypothetical protein